MLGPRRFHFRLHGVNPVPLENWPSKAIHFLQPVDLVRNDQSRLVHLRRCKLYCFLVKHMKWHFNEFYLILDFQLALLCDGGSSCGSLFGHLQWFILFLGFGSGFVCLVGGDLSCAGEGHVLLIDPVFQVGARIPDVGTFCYRNATATLPSNFRYFMVFLDMKFFPTLYAMYGLSIVFLLCGSACLMAVVVAFFLMPETKGLTLAELASLFGEPIQEKVEASITEKPSGLAPA